MPRAKTTKVAAVVLTNGIENLESSTNGNSSGDERMPTAVKAVKGRSKKAATPTPGTEDVIAEKPKSGRGRKKATAVEEKESEQQDAPTAEIHVKTTTKGRGKKVALEQKESVKGLEAEVKVSKATKGRGKKAAVEEAVTELESLQQNNGDHIEVVENTKVKETKATKSTGRGRKKEPMPSAVEEVDEEKAPTTKKRGSKKSTKTEEATKVAIVAIPEANTEVAEILPKKTTVRGTTTKAAKKLIEPLEEIITEKPTARRGRGKKAAEIVKEELGEEDTLESPKKKAKKEVVDKKKRVAKVKTEIQEDAVALEEKTPYTSNSKENVESDVSAETKPVVVEKKKRGAVAKASVVDAATTSSKPAAVAAVTEKKSRGRKRAVATEDDGADDNEVDGVKPSKAKKTAAAPLNSTGTNYNKDDFKLSSDKKFNLKISSWNVAGLRSWIKKDNLKFLENEEPDIFCLQETKCTTDQLPEEAARIAGYHPYWLCMPGGYAGVAIYSKIMPINIEYGIGNSEFDDAGRIITAEYEKFFLINVYVPNSGRKLVNLEPRMRWEQLFCEFVQKLDARKPVIICGDMNVSHLEIDLSNPKTNTRNAGFTKEERDKMSELLALGYVDTFRHLYPQRTGAYTFWTYMGNARARNVGWRLDYFIVSERIQTRVVDNCIRAQVLGSDHCPITLFLNL